MASLFKSPPKPPKQKAPLMPDEQTLKDVKKRSIAAQKSRSGRASTILSDTDLLGG